MKPKFLHVDVHWHRDILDAPIMRGGLYSWHRVFSGETAYYDDIKDRLSEYDIVFVAMSNYVLSALLLSRIRKRIGSKTRLVACVDYGIELWQDNYSSVRHLAAELGNADTVIVAEPMMESYLKVLTDRPIRFVNHPCDVETIAKLRIPVENRREEIVGLLHQYNNGWLPLFLATKDLPWPLYVAVPKGNPMIIGMGPFFRYPVEYREFCAYLEWAAKFKVAVDSYNIIHTFGRMQAENACLGIPTVGASCVYAQSLLWPDLTVSPGNVFGQRELIARLFEDVAFHERCCEDAWIMVQGCSYANSKKSFLNALDMEVDDAEIEIQGYASNMLP